MKGVASADARGFERTICPRCGGLLMYRYDGLLRWRVCRKTKSCGWTVFNHGDDPRDKR